MKRIRLLVTVLFLTFTLMIAAALPAAAGPKPKLPKLTGGGVAENNNSDDQGTELFSQFGFNAQATAEGETVNIPLFDVDVTVYEAKGQFQIRNVSADDPSQTDSAGHGEVVCIANYGTSSAVDGGGNPDADVWEIRVGFPVDPDTYGTDTIYGSFFVQDNGKTDYEDESFAGNLLLSPDCGQVTLFQLEPVVSGNLKLHD